MQKWLAASSIVVVIPELVEDKRYEYSLPQSARATPWQFLRLHIQFALLDYFAPLPPKVSSAPFLVVECLHWIMKGSPLPGLDPKKCLKSA